MRAAHRGALGGGALRHASDSPAALPHQMRAAWCGVLGGGGWAAASAALPHSTNHSSAAASPSRIAQVASSSSAEVRSSSMASRMKENRQ